MFVSIYSPSIIDDQDHCNCHLVHKVALSSIDVSICLHMFKLIKSRSAGNEFHRQEITIYFLSYWYMSFTSNMHASVLVLWYCSLMTSWQGSILLRYFTFLLGIHGHRRLLCAKVQSYRALISLSLVWAGLFINGVTGKMPWRHPNVDTRNINCALCIQLLIYFRDDVSGSPIVQLVCFVEICACTDKTFRHYDAGLKSFQQWIVSENLYDSS